MTDHRTDRINVLRGIEALGLGAMVIWTTPAAAQTVVETAHLLIDGSSAGAQAGPDRWARDVDYPCLSDEARTCHQHAETVRVDDCRYRTVNETEDGRTEDDADLGLASSSATSAYGVDGDRWSFTISGRAGLICTTTTIAGLPPRECSDRIEHMGLTRGQAEAVVQAFARLQATTCKAR